jgi:raffinose/stachyose/melibiose transport system substrate-binding protein
MKHLSCILLFALLSLAVNARGQHVKLIMGSWRTEDISQMRSLLARFTMEHPEIQVVFDPTPATEYDAVIKAQLKGGTAPDVFYLRSYAVSKDLFEQGFLEPLTDLPGLRENFPPATCDPWTHDQTVYGVPMIATSHGVYYNQDIFERLDLAIPRTWEELLAAAQTIHRAGIIAFANASGDAWTLNELVLYSIAPNFLGGKTGRNEYLSGIRCFNDTYMVRTFAAVLSLRPFLPPNQRLLGYGDSLQLFAQGKAAMWFGGSWDIPFFEQHARSFAWGVFAPPPPAGSPSRLTFHLDAGVGLNSASRHKEAARKLLTRLCQPRFGQLMADELPGFFPMHEKLPLLSNSHAAQFLALNQDRETDIRFVWERLREGSPSGYDLTQDAVLAIINGNASPQNAADGLQAGLRSWFEPAMFCGGN